MKRYKEYMDGITVSDTLHEKLRNLEEPKKKPAAWKKYSTLAAALVLVIGLGAWGLTRGSGRDAIWNSTAELGDPEIVTTEPAIAPAPEPMPNSPGMEMMDGYEVSYGETVAYYMLPYIEYGEVESQMEADIALPVGVTRRDLTEDELLALLGGETNLTAHLNWAGYEIGAYAMVWPDGDMWLLCIYGSKGDTGLEHFSLEVSPGTLPPTCLYYAESVLNNIWEREVMADSYDSEIGSSRRVTFMDGGYGYRFAVTGTDREAITYLVSRAVRFIIVGDGLTLEETTEETDSFEVLYDENGNPYTQGYDPNATTSSYDPSASPTPTVDVESAETRSPAPPEP